MWDIREPADFIDSKEKQRIVVLAGVRHVIVPYLWEAPYWVGDIPTPIRFDNVLFERDALPGPDGYAVYRRAA